MGFNRDNARKGVEGIEASKRSGSGGGDYTPMLTWKAGEKKFIKFLTPLSEVPTVDFYQYIIVGINEVTQKPIYRSFISPQDPGVEGHENNRDYIKDRGYMPKKRQIAVAVQVEPVYSDAGRGKKTISDWTVVNREFTRQDGTEVSVPNVGLIVQSHIFFGPLAVYAEDTDVEDFVWEVTRSGGDQNTSYVFRDRGEAPEVDLGEEVPDLDAYLTELSSEDRMRELIEHLPANWTLDQYAKKGQAKPTSRASQVQADTLDTTAPDEDSFADLRSTVASSRAKAAAK